MQTTLAAEFADTALGLQAEAILRKCVHCGFCTATCPTYQLLGDELDGPRGRIYLIKQVLEGATPTRKTQLHLDRCLSCRSCETTCPSGVDYGRLLDIGRKVVEARVPRPASEKAVRWALRTALPSPLFGPAIKLGRMLRPLLPAVLKDHVPPVNAQAHARLALRGGRPTRTHPRKVLLLAGCAQPALSPNINAATTRVLDAAGIQTLIAPQAGCCGAVRLHLGEHDASLAQMRANIDAWWPFIAPADSDTTTVPSTGQDRPGCCGAAAGVQAIVINASGCGATVKDYGHLLKDDPAYAMRAARVSALACDLSELLPALVAALRGRVQPPAGTLAWHPPCSLQHGQKLRGGVEQHLAALGFKLRLAAQEPHLCCGSAGTYSVLQPALSHTLRERKLTHLLGAAPDASDNAASASAPDGVQAIISANIGCITHLQSGTRVPVVHWVEVLDAALTHTT